MTRRLAVVAVALACAFTTPALARHHHNHARHSHHHKATYTRVAKAVSQPVAATYCGADCDQRLTQPAAAPAKRTASAGRAPVDDIGNPVARSSGFGSDLVSRARRYMGTNPTGWGRLWCGRFMAMIAPDAASRVKNPNMALDWAQLRHVPGQVGSIAVLSRGKSRKAGHVGVVTGFDPNGNPIIVSGNHDREVGEGVYPRSRVIAYVSPD